MKIRALVTLQTGRGEDNISPRKVFEMESGKELDRLLSIGAVEVFDGSELPANARFIGEESPPPKFEPGVEDGDDAKQDKISVRSDPGDDGKKGKKGKK